ACAGAASASRSSRAPAPGPGEAGRDRPRGESHLDLTRAAARGKRAGALEHRQEAVGQRQPLELAPAEPADRRRVVAGPELPAAHPHQAVEDHAVEGEGRSEEHTSELQSREKLVCRLLLDKKTPPSSLSASYTLSTDATV